MAVRSRQIADWLIWLIATVDKLTRYACLFTKFVRSIHGLRRTTGFYFPVSVYCCKAHYIPIKEVDTLDTYLR
jgi:hypothetical protein